MGPDDVPPRVPSPAEDAGAAPAREPWRRGRAIRRAGSAGRLRRRPAIEDDGRPFAARGRVPPGGPLLTNRASDFRIAREQRRSQPRAGHPTIVTDSGRAPSIQPNASSSARERVSGRIDAGRVRGIAPARERDDLPQRLAGAAMSTSRSSSDGCAAVERECDCCAAGAKLAISR